MPLTHFHFASCAYGGHDVELNFNKKTGLFEYRNRFETEGMYVDGPLILFKRPNPLEEQIITMITGHNEDLKIDPILVDAFVKYVKQYCRHWKNEYFEDVVDGESWEFKIQTSDFSFSSSGHMDYPANYETFLHKLTRLTGGKMF